MKYHFIRFVFAMTEPIFSVWILLRLSQNKGAAMKYLLNPPKLVTWWVSLALLVLGVLTHIRVLVVPALSPYTFWIVVIGLIIMLLATRVRGL